jgi:hypothetical protein
MMQEIFSFLFMKWYFFSAEIFDEMDRIRVFSIDNCHIVPLHAISMESLNFFHESSYLYLWIRGNNNLNWSLWSGDIFRELLVEIESFFEGFTIVTDNLSGSIKDGLY